MESTHLLNAAVSLILGLCAGWVMHRSGFCLAGAFRDIFLFRTADMFRALVLLVAATAVLFEAARLAGLLPLYPFPSLCAPTPANVIGGFLFGVGMVLAGGCVVGTLYRMGAGIDGQRRGLRRAGRRQRRLRRISPGLGGVHQANDFPPRPDHPAADRSAWGRRCRSCWWPPPAALLAALAPPGEIAAPLARGRLPAALAGRPAAFAGESGIVPGRRRHAARGHLVVRQDGRLPGNACRPGARALAGLLPGRAAALPPPPDRRRTRRGRRPGLRRHRRDPVPARGRHRPRQRPLGRLLGRVASAPRASRPGSWSRPSPAGSSWAWPRGWRRPATSGT